MIECITVCCQSIISGYHITFSFTTPPDLFYQDAVIIERSLPLSTIEDVFSSATWNGKVVLPPAASFKWANRAGSDQVDISVSGYQLYP